MYPPAQIPSNRPKILIAMLDWGLGHTTRCIPIIRQLQEQQCCIYIAGDQIQKSILETELHDIEYLELEGYGIKYAKNKKFFFWTLFKQLPKFLMAIRKEHRWLKKMHKKFHFQAIISDNRYGFRLSEIPSILITHQLSPISGLGNSVDDLIRIIHYRMIQKFQECWIPDFPGTPNLAGRLSHPKILPRNAFYIGIQSRFSNHSPPFHDSRHSMPSVKSDNPEQCIKKNVSAPIRILAIISGPEPQRSIMEQILLKQMEGVEGTCILVRGLPKGNHLSQHATNIQVFQHLETKSLLSYMEHADWIICRSGYSSIMDLISQRKKALLIPTPGQTEQEYLAMELQKNGIYPYMPQNRFDIRQAFALLENFPFKAIPSTENISCDVILHFAARIKTYH